MELPTVCAIMLTADRPALAKQAVECFRAQTYPKKRLLIWDTSDDESDWYDEDEALPGETYIPAQSHAGRDTKEDPIRRMLIGEIRNEANEFFTEYPILCHFDDDDWSHPNRIAEQVALMEATGAEVVGYNEMLFWRTENWVKTSDPPYARMEGGEAWLYRGTILGTSLMYRRETWQRFPFPATSYGEDTDFLKLCQHNKVKIAGALSLSALGFIEDVPGAKYAPRMIARIHAGNTSKAYAPEAMREATHHWSRVPEWDAYCREVME